ncbi:MAG: HlyD family efflux transporter periplasmic adaptor subunit [Bacteroidetes bacterium]|nr:HlyD family efflux transporter periplasmic adaptor subunit [Bacteroidota bacterium]
MANLTSCHSSGEQDEKTVRAVVPVTVISPHFGKMAEYTQLMATSVFLVKAVIRSPVTGYIEKCSVSPGDQVVKGQVLFQLRTKEAAALSHDSINSMNISGIVTIKASVNGIISSMNHQKGDFVQEGEPLSAQVQPGSLVFLLEVPFEMSNLIHIGDNCKLILPGNTVISAFVKSMLPSISEASQTRQMILQPRADTDIPENLIAKVNIVRSVKNNAIILPKSALLNDEVLKNFWVMKLINDSMAVKIPVEPGIQGMDSIEIVAPVLESTDRILTSGNYGLRDTAIIRIIKQE